MFVVSSLCVSVCLSVCLRPPWWWVSTWCWGTTRCASIAGCTTQAGRIINSNTTATGPSRSGPIPTCRPLSSFITHPSLLFLFLLFGLKRKLADCSGTQQRHQHKTRWLFETLLSLTRFKKTALYFLDLNDLKQISTLIHESMPSYKQTKNGAL